MISQEIRELSVEPRSISDFNRKLATWKFLYKRDQPIRKLVPVSKQVPSEEGKLENNRPKLWAEDVHRFQEF